jgi:integrase
MATILKRKQSDGTVRWTAQIRLARLSPVSQTFSDPKLAKEWAEQREKELVTERERGTVRRDVGKLTVEDLHLEYLKDPDTIALRSYKDIKQVVSKFAQQYGQLKVLDLSALHIREWRDRLASNHKPAGVNRKMAVVRSMWNWGRAARLIPADRMWPTRIMMKGARGRTRFLDDAELARLLAAAEPDAVMAALVTVALSTGMRRGELLRMEWADVDLQKQFVTIHTTKTDRPRSVYLAPAAVDSLKRMRTGKVTAIRGPVWLNGDGKPLDEWAMGKRWRRIRTAAKLADFKFHDLRHSCASWLAQSGASLYQIGSVLGHTNPSTTQRYAHLVAGAQMPGHQAISDKLTRGDK